MSASEVVLDTSAPVLALGDEAPALRARLRTVVTHAPHLIDAEVGSVLRRLERTGELGADEAATALHGARLLVAHRYAHERALAVAAWALRHDLTFHDALYVALATRLGVPLLTADVRMAHAPGLTCAVELV